MPKKGHAKLPAVIDADTRALTVQQQKFCEKLIECGVASKAAEKAGYKQPRTAAQVLMKHPLILLEIKELNEMVRKARGINLLKRIELADTTLERIMQSSPAEDGKRRYEDHLEAVSLVYEVAGLIKQHAQKRAPYYEDYSNRTEEELEYFVSHGYYPDDPRALEPRRPGSDRGEAESSGRTLCAPSPAPGHSSGKSNSRQS